MGDAAGVPAFIDDAAGRTLLSWQRTAMSTVAVAALLARAGVVEGRLVVAIPAAALLVLGAVAAWLFSLRIYARPAPAAEARTTLVERAAMAVVAVAAVATFASLAMAYGQ